MQIIATSQVSEKEFSSVINAHAIVVASGYEVRARYLCETLPIITHLKFALGFNTDLDILARPENDKYFESLNFKQIKSSGDEEVIIHQVLNEIISQVRGSTLDIVVDYSSMTRVWYAEVINFFRYTSLSYEQVNLYFSYSPALYSPAPKEEIYNTFVGPIQGFTSLSIPDKPTALLIGLGYEESRAFGLTEYFDAEPFLFYSDSNNNNHFCLEVEKNNKEILSRVNPKNIFKYPIDDLNYTYSLIYSLCNSLKQRYRIILAPCGPKPFTLLCLLVSTQINNVDVWRISAGNRAIATEKTPKGDLSIFKVKLIP